MLSDYAFLFTAFTTALTMYLAHRFLASLEAEAPDVYAELGSPRIGEYLWNNDLLLAFSQLILSRQYRARLADHPQSRAWASWLHAVLWLQLAAVVWLAASLLRR